MNTRKIEVNNVSNIVKTMNGGIEFYQKAKQEISENHIQGFFNKIIDKKELAVFKLQKFAVKENKGKLESGHDLSIKAREYYTQISDVFSKESTTHHYVSQLEEVEDKVLKDIDAALQQDQLPECSAVLRQIQADMKECHDEMKALKQSTRH
jgi:uncharacterized protein (TIGR02284 family)